jgi:hypothetical protein
MTVDPLPFQIQNPEVCDACAPNCGTTYFDFFNRKDGYLGSGTDPNDSNFHGYAYYINSIVSANFPLDPSDGCITSGAAATACEYAPNSPPTAPTGSRHTKQKVKS